MAVYEKLKVVTLECNTGTVTQYKFVKISGADDQVINTTACTDIAIGVAQETQATTGGTVPVGFAGVTKLKITSGSVVRGTQVTSHSDGGGKTAAAADQVHGIALSSAAVNDIIDVLLFPSSQLLA